MEQPRTLMEAVRFFGDQDRTLATMVSLRWPHGVHCPTCGRTDVRFIATRRIWECKKKHAKKQFSAKVGTIFEDSPLGLDKWFVAVWSIANCKNGISSYELARAVGVTQKSAWFMLHRIRLAMQVGSFDKFDGTVEADETFIGGLAKNMHAHKRARKITKTGGHDKEPVVGVLQRAADGRASKVRARHVSGSLSHGVKAVVREIVMPGAKLHTDAYRGYAGLGETFVHEVVNHAVEYVRGTVHTNGIENFWSLVKRTVKGTYVSVDPCHLSRYLDEQAFRFSERKDSDLGRFQKTIGSVAGKRLTYRSLIGAA